MMLFMIIAGVTYFILSFVYVKDVDAGISKYGKAALYNYKGVTASWDTLLEMLLLLFNK